MTSAGRYNTSLLPPWLWFWLITFLLSLPAYAQLWQQNLQALMPPEPGASEVASALPYRVLGIIGLMEVVPSVALFLGVLGLLLPKVRKTWLEQRYRLKPLPAESTAFNDLLAFLDHHAPGIEVKANLLRFDQQAFVYPLKFGKTGIAVFGALLKLWRSDRPMAEAILLHELAHYRHGDAFVVGAGSPFRAVVENWAKLYIGLFLVPWIVAFLAQTYQFFREIAELSALGLGFNILPSLIAHQLFQVVFLLMSLLAGTVSLLLWTSSSFVLPTLAIWCSELNADQAAARVLPAETVSAISRLPKATSWLSWLFNHLSHPPQQLRSRFAANIESPTFVTALLLLYPLTYLLRLVLLSTWALTAALGGVSVDFAGNFAYGLQTAAPLWLAMSLLFFLWPVASRYWERLFCPAQRGAAVFPKAPYWISAGVTVVLAIIGFHQAPL